jgi:replicative DNA helicase
MVELQLLNYFLDTKDSSLIVLNNLDSKFFPNYIEEWNYIYNHFVKYGNIPDKESFLARFPEFDIIKVNETPQYLIEELFSDYQKQQLAKTFNEVRKELLANNTASAVDIYQKAYEKLSTGVALTSVDILRDTSRYDAYVDRLNSFDKYYVRTGFAELDNIIGGWDREEELATIAARTNQGKSWLLLKFAVEAAKQGLVVGIYSGEMSERKVGYRIDTLIEHISNGALIHGSSAIQAEYKNYIDNLPNRFKGSIKVLTPKMINGPAGVMALRAFIEKDKLDILFVDQHSLLEDDRHAKNPVERASNISKDLKNLQVLKRIPIISVSQQNRTSTENGIGSEHIAQSDRIAQDSTIILFFERDKKDNSLLSIDLVKSRDSVNGKKLVYKVDFNTGTFIYIPQENDSVSENTVNYETRYSSEDEVFN